MPACADKAALQLTPESARIVLPGTGYVKVCYSADGKGAIARVEFFALLNDGLYSGCATVLKLNTARCERRELVPADWYRLPLL